MQVTQIIMDRIIVVVSQQLKIINQIMKIMIKLEK